MPVTVQSVQPFIMRNAIVAFGGVDGIDFAHAVSSAALTPSAGTAEFKGLKPAATFTFPQATTWTLDLTYAQDWSAADSLSRYLYEHRGEVLDFTINPDDQTTTPSDTVAVATSSTAPPTAPAV